MTIHTTTTRPILAMDEKLRGTPPFRVYHRALPRVTPTSTYVGERTRAYSEKYVTRAYVKTKRYSGAGGMGHG